MYGIYKENIEAKPMSRILLLTRIVYTNPYSSEIESKLSGAKGELIKMERKERSPAFQKEQSVGNLTRMVVPEKSLFPNKRERLKWHRNISV